MASVSDQVSVTIVHEASAFERLASRCDQDFLDKHDLDSLLSLNKRHLFGKPQGARLLIREYIQEYDPAL